MKKYLLAVGLIAIILPELQAQIEWEKQNGPYGGNIRDIIVHSSNTIYALGSNPNSAIFRSNNDGNDWTLLEPSVMESDAHRLTDLTLGPDGSIYALAYDNLYRSPDDGTSWEKLNTGQGSAAAGFEGSEEFAVNPLTGTLYVSAYNWDDGMYTIYRSVNAGATWTKGHQGSRLTQLVVDSDGNVYGYSNNEIWKSTNDGAGFTHLTIPVPTEVSDNAVSLVASPDGSKIAVSSYASTVHLLEDPFTTWNLVDETGLNDPTNYNNSTLLFSADGGTLFLFDHNNNAMYSRIASTAGAWTPENTTFLSAAGEDVTCGASFDANELYVGGNSIGVYKSINGGAGWIEANNGIENGEFRNMVVADNGHIIVAGRVSYRSSDDGNSWTKIATNNFSNYYVFKDDVGALILLAEQGGTSYRSNDNGVNWSPITNTPADAQYFASPDGTKILGFNSSELFYSADQGDTWSTSLTLIGMPSSFSFAAWSERSVGMDGNSIVYAMIYDYDAGLRKFYKLTLDNATSPTSATATEISFSTMGTGDFVEDVKCISGRVYVLAQPVSGGGAILTYSDNAGVNWTPSLVIDAFRLDLDRTNNYVFITRSTGSGYVISIIRNDGSVQTTINTPSEYTYPYGIALNSSGIAFAGFGGSSLHVTTATIVTPATPTNLVNSGSSTDRVSLQFDDNATNEQYYVIELFNGTSYDSITRTSEFYQIGGKGYVEVRGLEPNTSYQFRIYAQNAAGNSGYATITTSTLEECVVDIPENRSWDGDVNSTKILDDIVIQKLADNLYSVSDINNGALSGYTVVPAIFSVGCVTPTMHTYLLSDNPFIPNGNGAWNSVTNTLTIKWVSHPDYTPYTEGTVTLVLNATDPVPSAPQNAAAFVYNDTEIEVTWKNVAFENRFIIERKEGVAGTYEVIGTVDYPNLSFMDAGPFTAEATYFYRIKSENGNSPTPDPSPYSNEAEVTFKHPNFVLGETTVNETQINSIGTVWTDLNNDGFDDVIFTHFDFLTFDQSQPDVFQNDGTGDFQLVATNLDAARYLTGTGVDYDNDGDVDLFYSAFATSNRLYNGNGTFSFTKVQPTPVEGSGTGDIDDGAPFSASWVDYDNDGLLDLFVPMAGDGSLMALYSQNSDHTFSEVTTAGDLITTPMNAFAHAWADFDNDGDQDVFVLDQEDGQGNRLFSNNGDGTFTSVAASTFDADAAQDSQSTSWGDYDNDQDFDLFVGGEDGANILYRNNGDGTFTKTSIDLTNGGALGGNWLDVNNDGFTDLLVTGQTGNTLFINTSGTGFTKVTGEKIMDNKLFCIASSTSDYNNDGYIDVALSSAAIEEEGQVGIAKNALLFKNNNSGNNWVKVKLIGTVSNRSAIGAKIKVTSGSVNQIRQVGSHIGTASQNSLTQHFGMGTATTATVEVTWPSGLINNYTGLEVNQTFVFAEDGTGPVATILAPANNETDVPSNTTISITLDESATAVAGKSLLLYLNSDMTTAIDGVDLVDAVTSDNLTYTFTLPQKLQPATQYNISVDAGAFVDQFGNESLEFPTGLWTFTTGAGPAISTLSPAHNATAVATDAALVITFDETPTPVATKNIHVFNGATEILSLPVASNGTITGNAYELPAPAEGWPFNVLLEVTVDPGAFTDADANDFAGIASGSWTFTTIEEADVTPPEIVLNPAPPQFVQKGFGTSPQIFEVRDNKQVATVVVSVRKIADVNYTQVNAAPGANPDTWTIALSETAHFDAMGSEFFVTATDLAGNTSRNPEGEGSYKVYLNYTGSETVIPSDFIGFGGTKNSWKAFSIPFELQNPKDQIAVIFDELAELENKKGYRLLTIQTPDRTNWAEFPAFSTITRGQGYLINIKDVKVIKLPDDITAPLNHRAELFTMMLQPGWNMVGNPYLTPVNWDNVAAISSLSGSTAALIKFSAGTYSENQSLAPFEGAFVNNASTTPVEVTIPFLGQESSGGRKGFSAFSNDISADEWALKLDLRQADITYGLGAIGMSPDGSPTIDNYDAVTPPRFIDYLELNFDHPEHFQKQFTRDIVPTQDRYTWQFSVASNLEGMAELHWNNVPLRNSGRELFLLDIAGQKLVNMKETGSYLFDPKESSNFKIYFGENLSITPERVQLGKAYPNPTTGYTKISFSLPETGGLDQNVSLDIMDAMGRTVGTITQGRFNPGYHETSFDARELTNGFYTYRLTVQSKNGRTMEVNKLIIK